MRGGFDVEKKRLGGWVLCEVKDGRAVEEKGKRWIERNSAR